MTIETNKRSRRRYQGSFRARSGIPGPYTAAAELAVAANGPEITPMWESAGTVGLRRSVNRRDTNLRRALAGGDVLATSAALLIVVDAVNRHPIGLRLVSILTIPFVLLAVKALGLYDRDQHRLRKTTIDELPSLMFLSVLLALSVWFAEAALLKGFLTRPDVFALVLLTFLFVAALRALTRTAMSAFTAPERLMVVGGNADAERVAAKLEGSAGVNAVVCGRIGLHQHESAEHRWPAAGALSRMEDLARVVASHRIERVIISPDGSDQEEILHAIRMIKALGVRVSVLPRLLEVVGTSSTFEDVDGMTLLGVRHYGVSRSSAMLKRVMDILGASVGLALIAPLMAMLAVAVKLDSAGPVFFRQRRIGQGGEVFSMLKFRSMVPGAEQIKADLQHRNEAGGGLFKIADDPRVTRVGGLLRKTSLDELPQLLNVLGGSMSLVGPRPLVLDEDALIEGWQRRRLSVKPGMTGMWQIFGSARIPMSEMVKIDYMYGANWSLWLDVKILLRTVPYVLRRRGM